MGRLFWLTEQANCFLIDGNILRALYTKPVLKDSGGQINHLGMVKEIEIGQSAAKLRTGERSTTKA